MIGSFTIDPQDTETDIEYKITIGDFEYTEENEVLPNMQITKITVNEADITLAEGNTYTGAINIGDGIVDVKVYAKWNSGDSDYLIGENITTIKLPISVYVEQSNKSEI